MGVNRRGFPGSIALGGLALGSSMVVGTNRVVAQAQQPAGLTVRGDQFLLDGEPFRIVAGEMHYFRTHPDHWRDRLARMRALGLNTVDTYVAWNFHEPRRGAVDFSSWRDLVRFVETAAEVGLKVAVRPGPYICAEWDFGGLPAWLLADPDLPLRCDETAYPDLVDEWFGVLLPRLAPLQATRGGPVIAFQVENEYGSYANDQAHLDHLRKTMRDNGIDSLLYCSNGPSEWMLRGGNLPDVLATVNFGGDPTEPFAALRRYQPEGPLWCTEFWDGWFDHWGEPHHTTDPVETAADVEKILAAKASVSLYMAVGSTNFGWWAGANFDEANGTYQPTITSYDYDAPIGEAGELTTKFHRIREVIARHEPVPDEPLPPLPSRLPAQRVQPDATVGLLESLDALSASSIEIEGSTSMEIAPIHRSAPVHMEALGQPYGLIHYRTHVQGPRETAGLWVRGLADRALVFADGELLGTLDRNDPQGSVEVPVQRESVQLDLVVDTGGRINFGQRLNDPKGITDRVLHGSQALFGWEIRPLPLDDLSGLGFRPGATSGPAFHRAVLRIGAPADGFLALPGWEKGMVWLNGFLLGRYWSVGPQRTLYAPSPLWRTGENELIVLELHRRGGSTELRSEPDLG
ncbi:glycoside hydrolase family 35 protein [Saccharopolyspora spinosa]|uniref:Beta-galactosidase n=1 Tax=Saccharopolyspora spinosa TaxID=60894 RepID=A0A2N3XSV3_SACSN|nr:beta-galactosidase family protein [Saccharopolyspora spinosa]PKW13768.1 beta-galactosidase [Saccharopolyspora spinosa]